MAYYVSILHKSIQNSLSLSLPLSIYPYYWTNIMKGTITDFMATKFPICIWKSWLFQTNRLRVDISLWKLESIIAKIWILLENETIKNIPWFRIFVCAIFDVNFRHVAFFKVFPRIARNQAGMYVSIHWCTMHICHQLCYSVVIVTSNWKFFVRFFPSTMITAHKILANPCILLFVRLSLMLNEILHLRFILSIQQC